MLLEELVIPDGFGTNNIKLVNNSCPLLNFKFKKIKYLSTILNYRNIKHDYISQVCSPLRQLWPLVSGNYAEGV